jgi:hypothetical protein
MTSGRETVERIFPGSTGKSFSNVAIHPSLDPLLVVGVDEEHSQLG